jgi:hypothetical protein
VLLSAINTRRTLPPSFAIITVVPGDGTIDEPSQLFRHWATGTRWLPLDIA